MQLAAGVESRYLVHVGRPGQQPPAIGEQPPGIPSLCLQPGELLGQLVHREDPAHQVKSRPVGLPRRGRRGPGEARGDRGGAERRRGLTEILQVVEHQASQGAGAGGKGAMQRLAVQAGKLGTDAVRVGMLDVVIDGQRPLPGLPGQRQFAGGVARVAGVSKDLCFGVAIAVVLTQVE